jgi:hypothetical protein
MSSFKVNDIISYNDKPYKITKIEYGPADQHGASIIYNVQSTTPDETNKYRYPTGYITVASDGAIESSFGNNGSLQKISSGGKRKTLRSKQNKKSRKNRRSSSRRR